MEVNVILFDRRALGARNAMSEKKKKESVAFLLYSWEQLPLFAFLFLSFSLMGLKAAM